MVETWGYPENRAAERVFRRNSADTRLRVETDGGCRKRSDKNESEKAEKLCSEQSDVEACWSASPDSTRGLAPRMDLFQKGISGHYEDNRV